MPDLPLPNALMCNAWDGKTAGSSPLDALWLKWTLKQHVTHAPGVIPQLLAAPEPALLTDWRHTDVGWGLVMADDPELTVVERAVACDAPDPIRELLKSRPGSPVFRYRPDYNHLWLHLDTPDGRTRPVAINGSARGIGGNRLPHYLLIYGSPQQIPWSMQFVLQTAAFVGRLDLQGKALENYISHLLNDWQGSACRRDAPVTWATDHSPGDITWLIRRSIAEPLANNFAADAETQKSMTYLAADEATHAGLAKSLAANQPAWILTSSHGLTGPTGDPGLANKIGLLIDAEHNVINPAALLANWQPDGAIWYSHACCSAGCETGTNYADLLTPGSTADVTLAEVGKLGARIAPLPTTLLGAKKPLRAFIGHVEPTFDWTLRDPESLQVLTSPLREALYAKLYLKNPLPIAYALHDYHVQAGGLISQWHQLLKDRLSSDPQIRQNAPSRALRTKLQAVDHQSCVILGDPTVALPMLK